jgi:hypothetical protein
VNIEQMVKICNSVFMYAMFTFKCLQMAVMIQLFFMGTKKGRKKKLFLHKNRIQLLKKLINNSAN